MEPVVPLVVAILATVVGGSALTVSTRVDAGLRDQSAEVCAGGGSGALCGGP